MSVRWLRLGGGVVLGAGCLIPLVTRFGVLSAGDPVYLGTCLVGIGAGLLCVVTSFGKEPPRSGAWRTIGRLAALALAALVAGILVWLRPFAADDRALGAMINDDRVVVTSTLTEIRLDPVVPDDEPGLIFQPGARVDARAYVKILRGLAERGHRVIIIKQPFGIAFASNGEAAEIATGNPNPGGWYVGGHSLGGTVAAIEAADSPALSGLILWASYPASDISDMDKPAISVSGTNDTLSTPADIEASRADLPQATRFVRSQGTIHAFFGDYGVQPGDGEAGVSRVAAQAEIIAATHRFISGQS